MALMATKYFSIAMVLTAIALLVLVFVVGGYWMYLGAKAEFYNADDREDAI